MRNPELRRLDESVLLGADHSAIALHTQMCDSADIGAVVRDIAALANLRNHERRLVIFGASRTEGGVELRELDDADHAIGTKLERLAVKYLEPQLRLRYVRWRVRGKSLGVLSVESCGDAPYVIRKDAQPYVRSGEVWTRRRHRTVRMRRSELDKIYAEKFSGPLYDGRVRVQFAAEVPSEFIRLKAARLSQLPSTLAAKKIAALIDAKKLALNAGAAEMTYIGRLSQARIMGCDSPYDDKGIATLKMELTKIADTFRAADERFRVEEQAHCLNLHLAIEGNCDIECASLVLHIPANIGIYIPEEHGSTSAIGKKPNVELAEEVIRISENYDRLKARRNTLAFEQPIRVLIEPKAAGHKIPVHYRLHGRNLRYPVSGKLYIVCAA